ncbi:MAG: lycopene cyclase domain-containing protein [Flavobacteriales bacterium]|nr:lycopene cyclase domain-containing protein [Flavobacteriales bacterium]
MANYFYLFLDIISISFPLLATFDKRISYYKDLKYLFPAMLITGGVFITWDVLFTQWGVWGFNSKYLIGIDIFNLPMEEWLFFLCIPYASIFIYASLKYFKKGFINSFNSKWVSYILSAILIILAITFLDRAYTATTFFALAAFILTLELLIKPKWLSHFYVSYIWVLIPFFVINGFLTGSFIEEQVVWYNNAEQIGIRMGTIPIEDTFYGMLLILMNVSLFEYFKSKRNGKDKF